MTKWLKMLAVLLALCFVAAACGDDDNNGASSDTTGQAGGEDKEPTKIKFLKSNSWDAGTGGAFFSAVEEGYFEEEGVEVEPVIALGAATGAAALVTGSAEIAQSAPDAMVNALGQGADLVAVWQWIGPGVFGTLVNTNAGIASLADLKGKKIGVINRNSTTLFSTKVELAKVKLTEQDVEIVTLGCCAAQYSEMVNGNLDAIGTWDGQYLTLQQTAQKDGNMAWFNQTKIYWNEDYVGDIIVTTRKYLEENRDAVVGFLRALKRAQEFQLANPQKAVENAAKHMDALNASDPNNLAQAQLRAKSWVPDGSFDFPKLETSLKLYFDTALTNVHPGALDLEKIFFQDIPDEVNAK